MSEPYPLPAYAAHIWASGQNLVIQFPPLAEGQRASIINFAMTGRGVACLLRVLQERARVTDLRIGNRSTPCKRTIEDAIQSDEKYKAWIKVLSDAAIESAETRAQARKELEELGL